MKKIKRYIKKLYDIIMTPSMAYLPGNLAFFLVLSIFPILTLIGVIASQFSINIDSVVNALNTTLPSNVAEVLGPFIQGKGFDSNIGIFMIVGFFLASNGAHAIILASNNLYGFPNSDYIKRRIKAIFIIILIILLFIFMLGFIAFGNTLLNLLLRQISDKTIASLIYNLFVILKWPFAIFTVFFNVKLIYTIAPDWKILSRHTTRGAIFTTVSWIVVVQIYSYWVSHFANYDMFYGSLSNIVILMLLTYIISYILVIGIAINVKTYEYKIED
ncbi:MAG: YihY/virulence factor BrkB family protein [Bacilli bacterium]|nr:YihY/virulence factor BrkB family protein [Bacilli bacterium]